MRRTLRVTIVSTSLLLSVGCKGTQTPVAISPEHQDEKSVQPDAKDAAGVSVALIADVDRVGPGQEFSIGVEFSVAAGWAVLWENPGEMGIPSRVSFEAPAGFEIAATRYPGPSRLDLPNGAVGYGYPSKTILSAAVVSPDALAGRQIELAAEVGWMACRTTCVRGTARPTLSLEIAQGGSAVHPVRGDAWRNHQLALPRIAAETDGRMLSWKPGDATNEVRLSYEGAQALEFFPSLKTGDHLVGSAVLPIDGQATLVLTLRPDGDGQVRATGVIKVVKGAEYAFHVFDEAMPQSRP